SSDLKRGDRGCAEAGMLHRNGIVARFESSDGVIAGAGGARHVPRVAIDIRYRDLRIGNHRAGHVKDNTRDGAGPDLREGAPRTGPGHYKVEEEARKNPVLENSLIFGHGGHPRAVEGRFLPWHGRKPIRIGRLNQGFAAKWTND